MNDCQSIDIPPSTSFDCHLYKITCHLKTIDSGFTFKVYFRQIDGVLFLVLRTSLYSSRCCCGWYSSPRGCCWISLSPLYKLEVYIYSIGNKSKEWEDLKIQWRPYIDMLKHLQSSIFFEMIWQKYTMYVTFASKCYGGQCYLHGSQYKEKAHSLKDCVQSS